MPDWDPVKWAATKVVINNSQYDYRDDFVLWLRHNPAVWAEFLRKVTQAHLQSHKQRFSARAIIEVIRWETAVRDNDITFKINNDYVADMARLAMEVKPVLKGYFQIRGSTIRSDAA